MQAKLTHCVKHKGGIKILILLFQINLGSQNLKIKIGYSIIFWGGGCVHFL